MENIKEDTNRAMTLAGWTYLGIFIPILGILFFALSRSRISPYKSQELDKYYETRHESIRRISDFGLMLTILVAVFWFLLWLSSNSTDTGTSTYYQSY